VCLCSVPSLAELITREEAKVSRVVECGRRNRKGETGDGCVRVEVRNSHILADRVGEG
jgi:predicted metalloprotease